jgi:hypothetical protein
MKADKKEKQRYREVIQLFFSMPTSQFKNLFHSEVQEKLNEEEIDKFLNEFRTRFHILLLLGFNQIRKDQVIKEVEKECTNLSAEIITEIQSYIDKSKIN